MLPVAIEKRLGTHLQDVKRQHERRSESRIATDGRGREHELPSPVGRSLGILAIQRKGEDGLSESVGAYRQPSPQSRDITRGRRA